jgi:hypothetical protein
MLDYSLHRKSNQNSGSWILTKAHHSLEFHNDRCSAAFRTVEMRNIDAGKKFDVSASILICYVI